ncbi:cytochrome-c peroxidase [Verrucomicrobia bacterium]|nr:cytochrome-c peroxidase [Verrucomicrobiota bacterium]
MKGAHHKPSKSKGKSKSKSKSSFKLPKPPKDSDYYEKGAPSSAKVELGRLLFFDKILSGNQNISCATCHHPAAGTGDQLSLSVGEGGSLLGLDRDTGQGVDAVHERVPRNAPDIFNRGAKEFVTMFHDGRVELSPKKKDSILNPAGKNLLRGLDNVLAAQALFPVTSPTEMAGQTGENLIADLAAIGDFPGIWEALENRLKSIPEYRQLFEAAFPKIANGKEEITFAHTGNAIAAFESKAFRFDDSPFDHYLRGDDDALTVQEKAGMSLFYGKANCASCHSGPFMTDHEFHATAVPQIGPGKGHGMNGYEDVGRGAITGNESDNYRFRTPTLRNVALTGPWGHDGAFSDLKEMVMHQLNPIETLAYYDRNQAVFPARSDLDATDWIVMDDAVAVDLIAEAAELEPVNLEPLEIDELVSFLYALTDLHALDMMDIVPETVPSGLPVED